MKPMLFIIFFFLVGLNYGFSQEVMSLEKIKSPKDFDNIYTKKISSDSLVSSFMIWIKEGVATHKHQNHTEHVYVVNGTAKMELGEKNIIVQKGDLIVIPANTKHSVKVISPEPLKVLSIQAPMFEGKDRILVD